jgi:DNA-binding NarL/FixJ family response regulator
VAADVTTVLLADDHPVFRAGLRAVLERAADLEVVGEAVDGVDAVDAARRLQPSVVLMDLHMPELPGVEATREVVRHCPSTSVLVLTMSGADSAISASVRAGARGYLLKGAAPAEILAAVRAVAAGQAVFGAPVAHHVLAALADSGPAGPLAALTERERDVLVLVARGLDNPTIAARLHLSPATVRNYVSACLTKLGVASRAEAVAVARDVGL